MEAEAAKYIGAGIACLALAGSWYWYRTNIQ